MFSLPTDTRFHLACLIAVSLIAWMPQVAAQDASAQDTSMQADTAMADMPGPLAEALAAHGGLDTWHGYRTLEYTLERSRGGTSTGDRQVIDLRNRYVHIEGDAYTIGSNADGVWITPNTEALNYGPGPRFYSQTYFYFFAVPFVFADPGVKHEMVGQETVDGTTYDVVRMSYESGVGDAPDDVYLLYLDPESHQIRMMRYSVTYGNRGRSEPNSTIVYDEWQDVDGLLVPATATFRPWQDGSPGEQVAQISYTEVDFGEEAPSDSLFAMPDDAEMTEPPPGE